MWFCQMLEHAVSIEKLVNMVLLHTEPCTLMDVLDCLTDWSGRPGTESTGLLNEHDPPIRVMGLIGILGV